MHLNNKQKTLFVYNSIYSSGMITCIVIGMCVLTINLYPIIKNLDTTMGEVNEYIHNERVLSTDIKQFMQEGYKVYEEIEIFIANHTKIIDVDLKNLTAEIKPLITQTKVILLNAEKAFQEINTVISTANNTLQEIIPLLEYEKNISIEILHKLDKHKYLQSKEFKTRISN